MSEEGRVTRRPPRPAARTVVRSAPALGTAPVVPVDETLYPEKYRGYGFSKALLDQYMEYDRLQSEAKKVHPALPSTAVVPVVPDHARARAEADDFTARVAARLNARLSITNGSATDLETRLAEKEAQLAAKEAQLAEQQTLYARVVANLQLLGLGDAEFAHARPPREEEEEEHVVSGSEEDPEQPEEVRDGGYFSSVLPT